MRKITFDIETKNIFSDVGKNDPSALDISVICVHDSATDKYSSFFEADLKNLWPIIEKADMLIGFNSEHFDIPLLNKYYPGDLSRIKSLDLMKEMKGISGRRIRLDNIAEATLGYGKCGNGMEAVTWWKKGDLVNLVKYCIEDVRLTKELYEYALKNGKLKYKDAKTGGKIIEIPLDTSNWEKKEEGAMTHTLPF